LRVQWSVDDLLGAIERGWPRQASDRQIMT
jgi:hypothetical protein